MAIDCLGTGKLGTASNYTPASSGMIMFWLEMDSVSGTQQIMFVDGEFVIELINTTLRCRLYSKGTGNNFMDANTSISAGVHYHIAYYYDGAGYMEVWINGVLDNTASELSGTPTANTLFIGNYLDGRVEDFRFYDRLLTDNEITNIYGGKGHDSIYYGCLNRWMMNEQPNGTALILNQYDVIDIVGSADLAEKAGSCEWANSELTYRRTT